MKRLRYSVAMSLDGFIAGPEEDYDWILMDPDFDWKTLYGQFDTLLMGRKSYAVMRQRGMSPKAMGMRAFVVSTTLKPEDHRDITVIRDDVAAAVKALKEVPGKDIWLSGGGVLFRNLLDAGLVDAVDVAVMPVLLGGGVPLVPPGARSKLSLVECQARASGIVMLKYDVS